MGHPGKDHDGADGSDQASQLHQSTTVDEGVSEQTTEQSSSLKREFKERHVSMIAIGGAIGTGLIIGTGTALVRGGPASLLIAYCIVGTVVFFMMTALGEMATMFPMSKGFAGYATRFVDPALGYATGWNYFFKYAVVLPNNLTAAGIIIQYWRPDLNIAIFVTVFAIVIIAANLFHVSFFGEAEFWLSAIKLLVMFTLILTCFIISMGGQPSGKRIGFHYWKNPGGFGEYLVEGPKGRFLGWLAAMIQACFAYTGTEVVGVAFGEAPNPKKTIRNAIRQTLWRIVFFYVLGAAVLGMVVPYTNDRLIGGTKQKTSAGASPFVIAIQLAGIPHFPDVVNACLLVFVISAANADIYIGSRTLYGLAHDKQAPQIFRRTTKVGVPLAGVLGTGVFVCLAYMNVAKSSSEVFGYLVSLVTVFGTLNWVSILTTYLFFVQGLKAQGIPRSAMPYRGTFQPYGAWFALILTILLMLFNGFGAFIPNFTVSTFVTSYIGIIMYLGNILLYKLWAKSPRVTPLDMDLHTGRIFNTD